LIARNTHRIAVTLAALLLTAGACGSPPSSEGAADPSPSLPSLPQTPPRPAHDHGTGVDPAHAGSHEPTTSLVDGRWEIDTDGELIEVTVHEPGSPPTEEQLVAAGDFVERVRATAAVLADQEAAERAGYRQWATFDDVHMVNPDHVTDGRVLDPERPEFVMFQYGELLGFMFLAADNAAPGPQLGGPLTVWHHHRSGPACWTSGGLLLDERHPQPGSSGTCPGNLLLSERSPEMLHVWVVDHQDGPFASQMPG
jgi:hypothetical protein